MTDFAVTVCAVFYRVYYVAASRAIKRLFINVPTLSAENRARFEGKPINISHVS